MHSSVTARPPAHADAGAAGVHGLSRFAPLPLRLIVGYGFFAHGYAKLARGPDTFAAALQNLGVPMPLLLAWMTTIVELLGGIAILAGAFVPIVSVPMAIVLLTAMWKVHLPYGFFSVKLLEVTASGTKFGSVGYEIILLYLAGLVALVLGGAGPLSVDRWLASRPEPVDGKTPNEITVALFTSLGQALFSSLAATMRRAAHGK